MSILIKGMDMPKDHLYPITVTIYANGDVFNRNRADTMVHTAVEVPPHGRLIDADSAMECIKSCRVFKGDFIIILEDIFDEEPTIIEAEE